MSVREGQEEIIIGGDFNFDCKKRNICKPVKRFGNLMSESSLTQVIKENTRITEYSRTQIDLIFTSRPELYVSGVLHVGFSDHSAVFAVRKLHRMKPPPPRSIETRNYKRYDKDAFVQDLNNVPWPLISRSSCDDVDSSWDTFKILFNDVANSHAPTMKVRLRSREIPWVTPDIRQLMIERNIIHKKAIKTNKELSWSEFKRLRNLVTLKLRKAKQRYYSNHLKENEGNQKETWKSLKDLLGNSKKSDSVTTNLTSEEKRVKSSNFNHFFVNVARNLTSAYASAGQCFRRWLRPTNHSEKFTIRDITVAETRKALKELKPRKATGLDGIPSRLLKDAANVLAGPLTEIFNMTVGQGKIPKEGKKAKVIPVHKSGPRDDPENHRPISILPVVSKVLERLIHGQLSAYLKRMNFLCENQSGFRRNHSTATAVTHFTDNILTNIDKGLITGTVFIDFSKAFDTVEHDILLNKLEHYGVCSQSLRWFKDYLHERKQTVPIDTERSDELAIVTGVPQGSILGPLLFIIYINDMPNCIENCSVNLYADDTVIYYSGVSIEDIESYVKRDLKSLSQWLEDNKLVLNALKTKSMLFTSNRHKHKDTNLSLCHQDKSIEAVTSYKYLGVVFNKHISWKNHAEYVCNKVAGRIGVFSRIRRFITIEAAQTVYTSIIQPIFDYCSIAWSSLLQQDKDRMQRLQNRAARIIICETPAKSSSEVLKQLN